MLELFDAARTFNMEVQPQLVLLQKTLINIEGMGRQIYPDLDLWETAAPFMKKWMKNRIGVSGLLKRISENAPKWLDDLPEIPSLAHEAFTEIRGLAAHNRDQLNTLNEIRTTLLHQARRAKYQRLGGLALIGAMLSFAYQYSGYPITFDDIVPTLTLAALGIYWMYMHS